jgi:hypothetical protein
MGLWSSADWGAIRQLGDLRKRGCSRSGFRSTHDSARPAPVQHEANSAKRPAVEMPTSSRFARLGCRVLVHWRMRGLRADYRLAHNDRSGGANAAAGWSGSRAMQTSGWLSTSKCSDTRSIARHCGMTSPGIGRSPPLRFMILSKAAKSARSRRSRKKHSSVYGRELSATAVATN